MLNMYATRYSCIGNCSDWQRLRQCSEQALAGDERIEAASAPGAEEGGEAHEGGCAGGGAGAAADLALEDDRADAALGGIVGGRDGRVGDEGEEFGQILGDAAAERRLGHRGGVGLQERLADGEQISVAAAPGMPSDRLAAGDAAGPVVDGSDLVGPGPE